MTGLPAYFGSNFDDFDKDMDQHMGPKPLSYNGEMSS